MPSPVSARPRMPFALPRQPFAAPTPPLPARERPPSPILTSYPFRCPRHHSPALAGFHPTSPAGECPPSFISGGCLSSSTASKFSTYLQYWCKGGDIERATDWIFSHPDESSEPDATAASSSMPSTTQENLPDGGGKYKLKVIVSHIGTSTQCGHYVAHVHKDGRWVIFNDSKVGASVDPPKDMGYMYLFERIVQ